MKYDHKDLVAVLTNNLAFTSLKFMINYDGSLETDGETLNLIISAHISSMFTLMKNISENNEEAKRLVDDFIKNILTAVGKSEAITGMEVINYDKNN